MNAWCDQCSHNQLESRLDEVTNRLQEALASKDKLAKNFDETEKLYVDKIQSLQEELTVSQGELEKQTNRLAQVLLIWVGLDRRGMLSAK